MSTLKIPVARVFQPLLSPSRYKGAHGGRGSGKSHFFAGEGVKWNFAVPGSRGVCIREVQKDLSESAKRLIEDKIAAFGLGAHFDPQRDRIVTPGGGVIIFEGMQDHNAESLKSLEGFDWAWVEEAHTLSTRSLMMLRPTIRKPGSEIWFSWNRRRKTDAVDEFLTGSSPPSNAHVVQANWSDNPWFPQVLEDERQHDMRAYPERYRHIWEGDYAGVFEGAYYASDLNLAKQQGRIGRIPADPLAAYRVFCDLGGSSAKADAFAMWVCQFIAREIRVLDYYEAQGQAAKHHFDWLRKGGYDSAYIYLPHDGTQSHGPVDTTWAGAFKAAGWPNVTVVPNQGKGAARQRIEAARRVFPMAWFNEETTEAGRLALGAYHEKKDEARGVGLGPDHDWASHGADAYGLMGVCFEPPKPPKPQRLSVYSAQQEEPGTAWMGS